jgi:hypothetical protein
MINTNHLLKVTAAWVSIVYTVCFAGVAMLPNIRPGFMMYALHTSGNLGENVLTFGTFLSGLVIWNIVGLLGAWLFAWLFNTIKSK